MPATKTPPVPALPNLVQNRPGYAPMNPAAVELANLAAWHMERIGQMGYLAAPPEGATSQPLGMPANPAWTSRRVWLDEPTGSVSFDEQADIPLSGVAGTTQTILTVVVPAGFDGIIKWIANVILGGPFIPGSITWSIKVNNRPFRNFGTITVEKGTLAQGREVSPIRIFSQQIITYEVTEVIGGLTGSTVASLTGYYFPNKGVS